MERYGAFEVLGELGRGGMGVVYLARQPGLDRLVAIKVLPTADDSLAARLRHEADVLADLQHPHVVGIIDVGEVAGRPYLVMPYFAGGTLADVLRRDGALRAGQVSGVVAAMADALAAAHARGVLHRDVKPGNVLLSAQGDPYLGDFGIATGSSQTKTSTGELLGTVGYVAPETIAGQPMTAAADVYALGVLAYTALSGRGPIVEDSLIAALEAARTGRHLPLAEAAPDAPEPLVALIAAAMALDPTDRPVDLRAWAHDLRSAVPPEPVEPAADRAGAMMAAEAPTSMGSRAAAVASVESEPETAVGGRRRRTALLAGAAAAAMFGVGLAAVLLSGVLGADSDPEPVVAVGSPSAAPTPDAEPTGQSSEPPSPSALATPESPPPDAEETGSTGAGGTGTGTTSTGGTSTGTTSTGGTSTGGTSTGGTSTGGTSTGGGGTSAAPSPKPSPAAPKLTAPAAVTSGAARFAQVTARRGDNPEPTEVLVSVAWQASSGGGAASAYELRRLLVSPSGSSVQATVTVSGTSTNLRVPACHVGGGRYGWEVRARNSAGASAWTRLSATISDMRGEYGADATQMIRTAGAFVAYADAGNTAAPSDDQAWRTYNQSPTGGTLAPGTSVRLWYYGDPAPAS